MHYRKSILTLILLFLFSIAGSAQTRSVDFSQPQPTKQAIKNSPAYAELLLRKVEIETDLEDAMAAYTPEHPKVKELGFQLEIARILMDRVMMVNPADAVKLSPALGKLMVRKIEMETDLRNLKKQYKEDHPEVLRAKRKLDIFSKAVNEILP